MKYEDASWHYGGKFPKDLPQVAGAIHSGMFLAWALLSGLAGSIHVKDMPEALAALRARSVTPGAFFMKFCDGQFTDEDLNDDGNAFTEAYFDSKTGSYGSYLNDYCAAVGIDIDRIYYAADTWDNFDRLKHVLDKRFAEWRQKRGLTKSKAELKKAMFEALATRLSQHGFKLKRTKDRFERSHGERTDRFSLDFDCQDGKPGYRIRPGVSLRFETVEQIFHQTSKSDPRYQKDTRTIGNMVGSIFSGDDRKCEFLLQTESDLVPVTEKIMTVFQDFALPYFERFASLRAIDAELNSRPTERTHHRNDTWLRCSTGRLSPGWLIGLIMHN